MRTIAEGGVPGLLAAAQMGGCCFFCGKFNRLYIRAFMRAITKRLVFTSTTGAPVIAFTRHQLNRVRRLLCNDSFVCHWWCLVSIPGW